MALENDILLFWNSYRPILEIVRNNSTSLSQHNLAEMYARLNLPAGWQAVSLKQLSNQYNQARNLREEDGEGMPLEIAVIHQIRKAKERTEWMEELLRTHRLPIIGEYPSKFEYAVSYVSIPIEGYNIKFIPRFDGKMGTIIFDRPIVREWAEKGVLNNSFIDSSAHGTLFGDFEDMDGSYASAGLREKMNSERDKLFSPKNKPAIKLTLVYIPKSKPRVKTISFDISRLGEGEVDSFLQHAGYYR